MLRFITRVRDWYGRFERPISSISLIGGFAFNAIFLKRVDLFWENFWIIIHLAIVAVCILLINILEHEHGSEANPAKAHFWFVNILQFFFGGLFATFLVFYFRSATLSVTWPFLLLLTVAFIANERLKKHYTRLTFQISLFYLSIFSFAVFIVPVLAHRLGPDIFLVSGSVSLIALWLFLLALGFFAKEKFRKSKKTLTISIVSIFAAINVLYFLNLIPPLPLSLKDGGIYHAIFKNDAGDFEVLAENQNWLGYFSLQENIHITPGSSLYAYSAIFSPAAFNTSIVHEWQKYDMGSKRWYTVNEVRLSVAGGREQGYRTYSLQNNISAGNWRVNVETENGQIIGRLGFRVVSVSEEPLLITEVKE